MAKKARKTKTTVTLAPVETEARVEAPVAVDIKPAKVDIKPAKVNIKPAKVDTKIKKAKAAINFVKTKYGVLRRVE